MALKIPRGRCFSEIMRFLRFCDNEEWLKSEKSFGTL